jgi:curved DNA-binding protein CbpA
MTRVAEPRIPFKDYYEALQLHIGAASADVHDAYRRLVREYSADKDDDARRRLGELNEAYHVLASPAFRREYDRLWHEMTSQAPTAPGVEETWAGEARAVPPPPLAVMTRQRPHARVALPAPKEDLRWRIHVLKIALLFTLLASFWIIVGAAFVDRLA